MFEVGFTEIIVILGIALVVLGPEKLPKVAAEIGRWLGRARAMARQFKSQLDEEVSKAERDWSVNPPAQKPAQPAGATKPSDAAAASATKPPASAAGADEPSEPAPEPEPPQTPATKPVVDAGTAETGASASEPGPRP
jgi:sec-independent protein translocase protein TatB